MAKIDFSVVLRTPDGRAIKEGDAEDAPDLTLRAACAAVLFNQIPGDEHMIGSKKLELAKLGMKLFADGEVTLSSDDVTALKERIGVAYSPLVVLRAFELLDPEGV
jgi:hypothetical protein